VTVTGSGRGGRNQEVALSSALRLSNLEGVAIASVAQMAWMVQAKLQERSLTA